METIIAQDLTKKECKDNSYSYIDNLNKKINVPKLINYVVFHTNIPNTPILDYDDLIQIAYYVLLKKKVNVDNLTPEKSFKLLVSVVKFGIIDEVRMITGRKNSKDDGYSKQRTISYSALKLEDEDMNSLIDSKCNCKLNLDFEIDIMKSIKDILYIMNYVLLRKERNIIIDVIFNDERNPEKYGFYTKNKDITFSVTFNKAIKRLRNKIYPLKMSKDLKELLCEIKKGNIDFKEKLGYAPILQKSKLTRINLVEYFPEYHSLTVSYLDDKGIKAEEEVILPKEVKNIDLVVKTLLFIEFPYEIDIYEIIKNNNTYIIQKVKEIRNV